MAQNTVVGKMAGKPLLKRPPLITKIIANIKLTVSKYGLLDNTMVGQVGQSKQAHWLTALGLCPAAAQHDLPHFVPRPVVTTRI